MFLYAVNHDLIEFNLKKKQQKVIYKSKTDLFSVSLNAKKRQIAIADTKIYLLDYDGKLLKQFSGHSMPVFGLKFVGKSLFSCAQIDRFLTCWGLDNGQNTGNNSINHSICARFSSSKDSSK